MLIRIRAVAVFVDRFRHRHFRIVCIGIGKRIGDSAGIPALVMRRKHEVADIRPAAFAGGVDVKSRSDEPLRIKSFDLSIEIGHERMQFICIITKRRRVPKFVVETPEYDRRVIAVFRHHIEHGGCDVLPVCGGDRTRRGREVPAPRDFQHGDDSVFVAIIQQRMSAGVMRELDHRRLERVHQSKVDGVILRSQSGGTSCLIRVIVCAVKRICRPIEQKTSPVVGGRVLFNGKSTESGFPGNAVLDFAGLFDFQLNPVEIGVAASVPEMEIGDSIQCERDFRIAIRRDASGFRGGRDGGRFVSEIELCFNFAAFRFRMMVQNLHFRRDRARACVSGYFTASRPVKNRIETEPSGFHQPDAAVKTVVKIEVNGIRNRFGIRSVGKRNLNFVRTVDRSGVRQINDGGLIGVDRRSRLRAVQTDRAALVRTVQNQIIPLAGTHGDRAFVIDRAAIIVRGRGILRIHRMRQCAIRHR